jgi:hypothetical protein
MPGCDVAKAPGGAEQIDLAGRLAGALGADLVDTFLVDACTVEGAVGAGVAAAGAAAYTTAGAERAVGRIEAARHAPAGPAYGAGRALVIAVVRAAGRRAAQVVGAAPASRALAVVLAGADAGPLAAGVPGRAVGVPAAARRDRAVPEGGDALLRPWKPPADGARWTAVWVDLTVDPAGAAG